MPSLNPYLSFNRNCEKAFRFYQSVFGGELELYRFKDMPADAAGAFPVAEGDGELVMHVSLPVCGTVLMGCDISEKCGPKPTFGDNITLSVCPESEAEAKRIFAGLAEGGKVCMPLEKVFWADLFGVCLDQFGIPWMMNYVAGKCKCQSGQ